MYLLITFYEIINFNTTEYLIRNSYYFVDNYFNFFRLYINCEIIIIILLLFVKNFIFQLMSYKSYSPYLSLFTIRLFYKAFFKN